MPTDSTVQPINLDRLVASAREWGRALAIVQIRNGETSPREGILSGEWAGDLMPADIYRGLMLPDWDGGRPRWVDADTGWPFDVDAILTELLDEFEDAYVTAPWPDNEEES